MIDLSKDVIRLIKYLNFKMECISEVESREIGLDLDKAKYYYSKLEKEQQEKVDELKLVMPKIPVYKTINRPKSTHKKGGTLSAHGEKWFKALKEHKLSPTRTESFDVICDFSEPNPNSTQQVKDWLHSLGWKPCTYKFVKDKETGQTRQIEQVREDGELTPSVLALKDKQPAVELLEGLSIIQHRMGIFQGFIDCAQSKPDGTYYIKSEIGGMTNTLRLRHKKPLVNLPKVGVAYGEEIRSCLVAPDGFVMCGSDMVSLEDTTKRHYMQPLDPGYVKDQSTEGFDPHLDLALRSGAITEEQLQKYNEGDEATKKIVKPIRQQYKTVNYSAIYGVGKDKLARELDIDPEDAKILLDAYWSRNWSVRALVKRQETKELKDGSLWLKNPVSGLWYSLRNEKDIFSTLNQGTGAFVFDKWLYYSRQLGSELFFQYHDEQMNIIRKGTEVKHTDILQTAIDKVNQELKLNVTLKIDTKYGRNYASVH